MSDNLHEVSATADHARRLEVGIADLLAMLHQTRLIADAVCDRQKAAGQPTADLLALSSRMIDCEIQAIEVSSRFRSLTENKSSEPITPQVAVGLLH